MTLLPWIVTIIAALANSVLGFTTYYKNPKSRTNQTFSLFAFTLATYLLVNQISLVRFSDEISLLWMRVVMVFAVMLNSSFFLMAKAFPRKTLDINKLSLNVLVSFSIATAIIAISPLLFTSIDPLNYKPIPGPGMGVFLLHTLFYLIGGVVILIRKYLKSKGVERSQLRFVLFGASVMFALILTTNVGLVFILNNSSLVGFLPIHTTIFAISIAYSIIKYRFLDIGSIISKAVGFALTFGIIYILYASALVYATNLLPSNLVYISNVILICILIFTFNVFKEGALKATEKIFQKKSYKSASLLDDLGKITTSTLSINMLTKRVLKKLANYFNFSHAQFIFIDKEIVGTQFSEDPSIFKISSADISYLIEKCHKNPLALEDITYPKTIELFKKIDSSVIIPIITANNTLGLLSLGPKKSGDIYNNQDLEVLDLFIPQISVAIQNSLAYEKIRRFNLTLEQEVKSATAKLQTANKNLRHLDKLKDEFVFVATHELKNPVTAMKGYLSMINEGSFGKVPKNLSDPIDQLTQSNQQLVNLVNELLQIARSEAHTLTIHAQEVELNTLIEVIIANVKPLSDQKKLKISYPQVPNLNVYADPDKLKEILNNLLTNAIKYSEKGTISITHVEESDQIITHVKDQGVGIAQKDQAKLFTRFFRVEEEAAKGIPGSGLGLFIVRQLVEKMGGKIWFTSQLGVGSTFSFSLPKSKAKK